MNISLSEIILALFIGFWVWSGYAIYCILYRYLPKSICIFFSVIIPLLGGGISIWAIS